MLEVLCGLVYVIIDCDYLRLDMFSENIMTWCFDDSFSRSRSVVCILFA